MAAFAAWITERRVRRVGAIAVLFLLPFVGIVSAAVVVLVTSLKGPRVAVIDCALALVALSLVMIFSSAELAALQIAVAAVIWGLSIGLGYLTASYASLTLPIQVALLVSVVTMLAFIGLVGDPSGYWLELLRLIVELSREAMGPGADPLPEELLIEVAPIVTGFLAAGLLASVILSLLLGTWWACGVQGGSFAGIFREIRIGYAIGGVATVAGIAALLGLQPLAGNVLLVLGTGFLFQGVAVCYWWAWSRAWPKSWWIALYLPLFLGPAPRLIVMLALVALGFIDNWYSLRLGRRDMV